VAAIAPHMLQKYMVFEILALELKPINKTIYQVLVVGSEEKGNTRGNKVSICFSTGHKPGSLAKVLVKLAELEINLSKIQSVPRLNGEWEYMFYLDLELNKNTKSDIIKGYWINTPLTWRYLEFILKETCYMIVKPADRTANVQEYYFSQKLAQIDRMRREGSDVINLGIGSPISPF